MNLDFNIRRIVKHSSTFKVAEQKISEMWLNSSTEAAYYALKGHRVQSRVLHTNAWAAAWAATARYLVKIRVEHPEITKEEVIELVRKEYAKIH